MCFYFCLILAIDNTVIDYIVCCKLLPLNVHNFERTIKLKDMEMTSLLLLIFIGDKFAECYQNSGTSEKNLLTFLTVICWMAGRSVDNFACSTGSSIDTIFESNLLRIQSPSTATSTATSNPIYKEHPQVCSNHGV